MPTAQHYCKVTDNISHALISRLLRTNFDKLCDAREYSLHDTENSLLLQTFVGNLLINNNNITTTDNGTINYRKHVQ